MGNIALNLWVTVGGMRRGGFREDESITRYKPC